LRGKADGSGPSLKLLNQFHDWSIRKKLLVILLPAMVVLLLATGYVTNFFSARYIAVALERNTLLLTLAQAHEIEQNLARYRDDLIILAKGPFSPERLKSFLASRSAVLGPVYRELAFSGVRPGEEVLLLETGSGIVDIDPAKGGEIRNSPLSIPGRLRELVPGQVDLSACTEASYPAALHGAGAGNLDLVVTRMTAPALGPDGSVVGYVVLSVDALAIRNILSVFNSQQSPLHGFPRTPETRFSFLFDPRGWILFQSENVEEPTRELSTETARAGLAGDHGLPGLPAAFRPEAGNAVYWTMVSAVLRREHGLEPVGDGLKPVRRGLSKTVLGYAPVTFVTGANKDPEVVWGVAYVDKSRLGEAAVFQHFNIMFVSIVVTILLLGGLIVFLSQLITRPILDLAREVTGMLGRAELREIALPDRDRETSMLKRAVNNMIGSLVSQEVELKRRDDFLQSVREREKAPLASEVRTLSRRGLAEHIRELVGAGPAMQTLINHIRKAASVDADVLVIGETGTGKELTAEAIHRYSARSDKPFISINCGALDENLLMDALFGHVKGAFSEAKASRKGAFLAADGGTLHLDEIGNASPRVQQALLRALSVRRIRPLGSDQEQEFNVRVIAATNVNLKDKAERGEFREDLYYRLQVITINTPPLRERKEDIALLADHFLKEAEALTGKKELGLSKGALEKMRRYDWPGNIRELKNCLTRAVVLTEGEVIQAEEIVLGRETAANLGGAAGGPEFGRPGEAPPASPGAQAEPASRARPEQGSPAGAAVSGNLLNPRQQKAMAMIMERGEISRSEYQELIGGNLPARTAVYDLQDLVRKGLLVKVGQGPATKYLVAPRK
jgi:DNA-binding NtrC family response regulator